MKINTNPMREVAETERTSSKGNQNKWCIDGIWYKEDGLGYEALAEVLVSRLLEKTNVSNFVKYEYEPLEREEKKKHGCKCADFLCQEDDKILSIERLFQINRGEGAAKAILKYEETADRIKYVMEQVEKMTGLNDFGTYLKQIMTVDALFLNEDRHFHNLAVILCKDGSYRECPLFDNGAAFFSDIRGDYPLEIDLEKCYEKIEAKPFSRDFDRQLDACDLLRSKYRFHANFTMKDVDAILQEFTGIYEDAILNRVRETMRVQMRKYAYFF
jgi:hypothetical protein